MNRIFVLVLAISSVIFAANGTLQNTIVNPDGSGIVSRRFPLTLDQVNAGALTSCLALRPSPIFSASIEISGTQTSCVHTALFASMDELRQVYATVPGVSINQLTMQNGRFIHDINLTPSPLPANLTTDVWQVQMPGAIIADNASVINGKTLGWEAANGCNNSRLYAASLDGQSSSNSVFLPLIGAAMARPLAIASIHDLGTLGHPTSVSARDVGASAMVGRCILWMFGDTLFNPKSVDGANLRSSTAGLANPADPYYPIETLDANGAPYDFLQFTDEEKAYNQNSNYPNERYALWVESAVASPDGNALVYYTKLKVHPGNLNYELLGSGVAIVPAGTVTATRDTPLLFNTPEPPYISAFAHDSYIYVYGCKQAGWLFLPCYVARAPITQARTRSAYTFWNGTVWDNDINQAAQVFEGAWSGLTVSWNPYLGKFLRVNSQIFSDNVLISTAPAPQGPWSTPIVAFSGLPASGTNDYTAREHPELSSDGGRKLLITYYRTLNSLSGELRLVEVTLQ